MIQKNKNKLKLIAKPQDQATKDSILVNKYNDQEVQSTKPGNYKQKNGKTVWVPDRTKAPYKKEKGGKVCPKCGKVHAAGMGCAIAKSKMYRQGGGLNRISFMQQGKNLPTAPKAEDRYRGGQRVSVETKGGRYGGNDRMEIKEVQGKKPGMFGSVPFIRQTVLHSSVSPDYNDTTYIEVPERKNFLVERKLRGVEKHPSVFKTYYSNVYPFFGSILPDLGSGTKEEYETLKRRFNTAWNLAK